MLIPRIIPCLLFENAGMVKTRRFKKRTYLGDPVNVVNLFNQFEVDEIVLLDIGASPKGARPDFELIESIAEECWVPLAYGGGVRSLQDIERLILSGVEKVVLGTIAARDISFVTSAAREFGNQCIVGSIDAKKKFFSGYDVMVCGASKSLKLSPQDRARQLEDAGVGEILLQSIDRDGEMVGYDLDLVRSVTSAVNVPVVACSGAASPEDLPAPIKQAEASASAAGSIFVFSGKERGVLINFPERSTLEAMLMNASQNNRTTNEP